MNGPELERYKSHKTVRAMKITEILRVPSEGAWSLTGENGRHVLVEDEYYYRHRPQIGGYFVQYEDGYRSFSPATAFEDGYTKITD